MRYLKPLVEMRCSSRRQVHICTKRAYMPSLVVAIFKIAALLIDTMKIEAQRRGQRADTSVSRSHGDCPSQRRKKTLASLRGSSDRRKPALCLPCLCVRLKNNSYAAQNLNLAL